MRLQKVMLMSDMDPLQCVPTFHLVVSELCGHQVEGSRCALGLVLPMRRSRPHVLAGSSGGPWGG